MKCVGSQSVKLGTHEALPGLAVPASALPLAALWDTEMRNPVKLLAAPRPAAGGRQSLAGLLFSIATGRPVRIRCRPMRQSLASLLFSAALLAAVVPLAGAAAQPRYEAEVEVADRSATARQAAAREGLESVLVRVTGLPRVATVPAVAEALRQSERYYNRFLFVDERRLRFFYSPRAVLDLVGRARLPLWPTERPGVMAWLAVEQGEARQIVQEDHPLAAALTAQARQRGLQVYLPLMDLQDQLRVQPAVVWSGATLLLVAASRRYGAQAVLIGRLSRQADGGYAGRLLAWADGADFESSAVAVDLAAAGTNAADFLADGLAHRQAIPWREPQWLRFAVQGIAAPLHYGGLLRYLEGLEFVMGVRVVALNREKLEVEVRSRAEMDQLIDLLAVDERLDRTADSLGSLLLWRASSFAGGQRP